MHTLTLYFSYGQMLLNWDVLTEILSFLDRANASRMSRTCRTLHQAPLVPRILLDYEVTLWSPKQLVSFCRYILPGSRRARFQYFLRLNLRISGRRFNINTPQLGELLAAIFARSTKLEWLSLSNCALLEIDERIPPSLLSLTKLRTLVLNELTERTGDILKHIPAALTSISMDAMKLDDELELNAIPMFAHFKDSLETLGVTWADFIGEDVLYTRVTNLSVGHCYFPELRPIIRCFPNLRDLHIDIGDAPTTLEEQVEAHRLLNLASQPQTSWTSFSRLSGSLHTLYMLGIQCTAEYLNVIEPLDSTSNDLRLGVVLSDVRPTTLRMVLRMPEFDISRLAHVLSAARDTVKGLILDLEFYGEEYKGPTPQIVSPAVVRVTLDC